MLKFIKFTLLLLVGLYLLICGYMFTQQKNMLFIPVPEDPAYTAQFKHSRFDIDIDGFKLHGWMQHSIGTQEKPFVIYYGGNAEEVSHHQTWFAAHGISDYLLMNYRGYGKSSGAPSEAALKSDALAIFDHVVNTLGVSPQRVVLMGRSLGSGIASYVASEREVAKVVLITPYDSIASVAQGYYPWLPVSLIMTERFDSLTLAPNIDEPVLCLIAETDRIVPTQHARRLCSAWKGPDQQVVIPASDHINIVSKPEFKHLVKTFLD